MEIGYHDFIDNEIHQKIFDELIEKYGFTDDTVGTAYIEKVCSFCSLANKYEPNTARICAMVNGNQSIINADIFSINQVLDIFKMLGVNVAYYEAKAEKAAKRRATSKFNYESAGGYYVPTKEQLDAAFKCFDELKLTPQQEEACNRVISGYILNEKIYHDNIHIVNELKREHNF